MNHTSQNSSWFDLLPNTVRRVGRQGKAPGVDESQKSGFARLWAAFMTARIAIAVALLCLHVSLYFLTGTTPAWVVILSAIYFALALAARLLAKPKPQGRAFDAQWIYTVGVDLAFFGLIYNQANVNINFSPLLALPVLTAAILGSRSLALGTATLAALILLGRAAQNASSSEFSGRSEWLQAGLVSVGLLVLGWLISYLTARLAREERTARRSRAEARQQTLVNEMVIETLADGVLVVDAQHMVHTANPAARLMLGSDQDVTPPFFNLGDNPAWAQLARIVETSFNDGEVDSANVVLRHAGLQSSHLQVRTLLTPPIDDGGQSLCVMFLQDQREMEARLRTEKLAAMGRMSAAMAHEIRNPLASISQANALLEEDLTDATQRHLADMVRQNAQRLAHIVDDVLAIARVQHQGSESLTQALDLDETTQSICKDWAQQNDADILLRMELKSPEMKIEFAREHLRRVLINLLDNAWRYASRSEGSIKVATQVVRDGTIMLGVWSDGAPLEPTVRRHLFEPFFSSESRSTGLGLFICRELCERHGAVISYERAPREQGASTVEGNEFLVSFRPARSPHLRTQSQEKIAQ